MNLRAPCTYMRCTCSECLFNNWIIDVVTSCVLYPSFLGARLTENIFSVASHVGNPCGHTFCGACGWQWHTENVSWMVNFGTMINRVIEKQMLSLLPKNPTRNNAYDTQYCHG